VLASSSEPIVDNLFPFLVIIILIINRLDGARHTILYPSVLDNDKTSIMCNG